MQLEHRNCSPTSKLKVMTCSRGVWDDNISHPLYLVTFFFPLLPFVEAKFQVSWRLHSSRQTATQNRRLQQRCSTLRILVTDCLCPSSFLEQRLHSSLCKGKRKLKQANKKKHRLSHLPRALLLKQQRHSETSHYPRISSRAIPQSFCPGGKIC